MELKVSQRSYNPSLAHLFPVYLHMGAYTWGLFEEMLEHGPGSLPNIGPHTQFKREGDDPQILELRPSHLDPAFGMQLAPAGRTRRVERTSRTGCVSMTQT